ERGEGFSSVAARLEDAGLVPSAWRFRILGRLTRADRSVRAGTYTITPGTTPRTLLDDFVAGRVRTLRVTVPEGWRLPRIAEEMERVLEVPADAFLRKAADPDRLAALEIPAEAMPNPNLEGYLFPETYHFPDGATAGEVIDQMTDRFLDVWDSLPPDTARGMTRHEIVTLASIVEAEAAREEEKPRIAAVYLNRLEIGWRLQADPTVRYGLDYFTGRLYYKHLDIDTPYNSYRNDGLPPGPIGAPGRASLLAVLEPLEPCDDLFFVASGDGWHTFTRTAAEHVRAKNEARRNRNRSAGQDTVAPEGDSEQ
ncbi:MAG: endolytic transglycosylase MltG, partial [Gemmatimonadetes bacterium]|nr:endolytic transglycosylase MltG [Gemmatimonadota bacterium]